MVYVTHALPKINTGKGESLAPKKEQYRGNATVPAEHVLDMRKRSEIDHQPMAAIKKAYPQYSSTYIRSILSYQLRANLRVKPI